MSTSRAMSLELTADQMRRFGYAVIDLLVDHFENLPSRSVGRAATPKELAEKLDARLPIGSTPEVVLQSVAQDVLSNILHLDHPRFFGFVSSPNNFVNAMADALASGFNVFAGTWLEGRGPAHIEQIVLGWLKTMVRNNLVTHRQARGRSRVQSAEDRLGSDRVRFPAALARIGLSDVANGRGRTGNTRTERHVRTGSVVMGGPHSQDGPQMRFGQRYQLIQTLAPNGYGWHQDMG